MLDLVARSRKLLPRFSTQSSFSLKAVPPPRSAELWTRSSLVWVCPGRRESRTSIRLGGASLRQLHSLEKAAGGQGPSLAASTTRRAPGCALGLRKHTVSRRCRRPERPRSARLGLDDEVEPLERLSGEPAAAAACAAAAVAVAALPS
eukprot:scaffold5520_cov102-Isochrysis_galbana.AAC.2